MKGRICYGLMVALLAIGTIVGNANAQTANTFSITVPGPAPTQLSINVPAGTQCTLNGILYDVGGTLVLNPHVTASTPTALPKLGSLPPTTNLNNMPSTDFPPVVQKFADPTGAELMSSLPIGGDLSLVGMNFGLNGGLVFIGNDQIPFSTWSDNKVTLTIPSSENPTVDYSVWTILRSGGAYNSIWGPPLKPKA